ncbi:MAG TPA: NADH-quinone oxidoreductase subunit NuoB [Streptosporangiaceae bacterium]|nr:NADH-quinone oxidoreductase subunit NuoB [Streptosporangiaceae bacterium]
MAAVDLPLPGLGAGSGVITVDAGGACSLRVFDAGLACCGVEVAAALRRAGALAAAGDVEEQGAPLNIFVVAGTVTDKLAPFVLKAFQDTPAPRRVLSFGACSNSGGPYWDSYCVTKGVDQLIPVDVYVPGCPPRPEALLEGLALVLRSRGSAGDGERR